MFIIEFLVGLIVKIIEFFAKLFNVAKMSTPPEQLCTQPADPAEFASEFEARQAWLIETGIDPEPLADEINSWPKVDRPVLLEDDDVFGETYITALENLVHASPKLAELSKPLIRELKHATDGTEIEFSQGFALTPVLNVALVEDTSSMFVQNPVDLVGRSVIFTRNGSKFFDFETVSPGKYDTAYEKVGGSSGGIKIPFTKDDASYQYIFKSKLKFRLYNKVYTDVYISTNGNLTFGKGFIQPKVDQWSFRNNLPAVAPLWTDLDPSKGGEIILHESKNRLVVTWLNVPLKGSTEKCTFQVILFDDGKTNQITFSYKTAKVKDAVVGISPGNKYEVLSPRDFYLSWKSTNEKNVRGCIVEEFSAHKDIDPVSVAQAFYKDYDDEYDSLVIFSEPDLTAPSYQNIVLYNDVEGIGSGIFNKRANYKLGNLKKLSGLVRMGSAQNLNDHPYKAMRKSSQIGIHLLAHEQAHRWLVDVQYWDGAKVQPILTNRSHWLPLVNSRSVVPPWGGQGKNSVMYGSSWREVKGSPGLFERELKGEASFGSLDLYLMGLCNEDELVDSWFIQTSAPLAYNQRKIKGKRIDLTLQNLANKTGKLPARKHDIRNSPKSFRSAFILVHDKGVKPDPKTVAKVARYASAWEIYFQAFSELRALWHTHLTPKKKKLYVSGTGSDTSGKGTDKDPYRTLTKALSVAKAGSSIIIGKGTYDATAGEKFPIILPPEVWVEGVETRPKIKGQGSYTLNGKTYQTTIVAPMDAKLHRVTVENGAGGAAILFADGEPKIMRCNITTLGKGTGILLAGSASGSIVHCDIEDNQVGVEILGDKPCGPMISGNVFDRCKKAGLLYKGKSSPHVFVNVFQNGDIGIEGHGTYSPIFSGNEIISNRIGILMVDTRWADFGGGRRSCVGGNTIVANTDAGFWNQTKNTFPAKNNIWSNYPLKIGIGPKPPTGGKHDIFNSGGGKVDHT